MMKKLVCLLSALVWTSLVAIPAWAQEDLVTDRPDQTESAVTVAPGKVQIETGILYTRDEFRGESFDVTQTLGTLVRIGLDERLELRLGADGWISSDGPDGLGDGSIGVKFLVAEETANSPQVAVLVQSSVPIGESGITSDDYAPAARLAFAKGFRNFGLGFNLGAEFPEDQEILLYTLAAGIPLDEANGVFVEIFGDDGGDGESAHSFDAGWTFLARANLQFDVAAGFGLSSSAPDWFAGVGFSVRLPE